MYAYDQCVCVKICSVKMYVYAGIHESALVCGYVCFPVCIMCMYVCMFFPICINACVYVYTQMCMLVCMHARMDVTIR